MSDFAAMVDGTAFATDHKGRPFGQALFSDVTVSIPKGRSLAILGDESSGAIDIVQAFGGIVQLQAGEVVVGGQKLGDLRSTRKARLSASRKRAKWAARELGFISLSHGRGWPLRDEWTTTLHLTGIPVDGRWAGELFAALGLTMEDLGAPIRALDPMKQLAAHVAIAFNCSPSLAIWPGTNSGISSSKAAVMVSLAKRASALRDATLIYATPDSSIASSADVVATVGGGRVRRVNAANRQALPFLSYVSEDGAVVDKLESALARSGIAVWRDRNELAPGVRWKDEIRHAIRSGQHFIACFSSASIAKDRSYAREELALAIEELRLRPRDRAWFIPVRLDACSIEDLPIGGGEYLSDIQYVDLAADWHSGVSALEAVLSAE